MNKRLEHVFPAVRGNQGGKEFFVSVSPLQIASNLFQFAEESVPDSVRRDRVLHQEYIGQIVKYMLGSPHAYVLAPLQVSVDGQIHFDPIERDSDLGFLRISMSARFVVNGGEHERAAVASALRQKPALANEKIAVVFHPDRLLKRADQMYADLRRFSRRPSSSLRLLHSTDDDTARLCRELIARATPFRNLVETKRSALSPRSKMLFTLSAVYQATRALLAEVVLEGLDKRLGLAIRFWNAVDAQIPEWRQVRNGKMLASELRAQYLHSHGLALHAIGKAGGALLAAHPNGWAGRLRALRSIDWRRANGNEWEGRALIGGKVSKATTNVVLTANVIKKALGLPLAAAEEAVERAINSGRSSR